MPCPAHWQRWDPRTPTLAPGNSNRISSCQCLLSTLGPEPPSLSPSDSQDIEAKGLVPIQAARLWGPRVPICNNGSKEAGKS